LSPKQPRVVISDVTTLRGRDEQRGAFNLATGVVFAMRIVVAHNLAGLSRDDAACALATMSFLARQFETATRVEDPDQPGQS
jgi:hypothetical protein